LFYHFFVKSAGPKVGYLGPANYPGPPALRGGWVVNFDVIYTIFDRTKAGLNPDIYPD